jgi:CPA1 family monovalent cation:H+ antiporter
MHDEATLSIVVMTMGLMFSASMVAIATKWIRFPFTIALVIIGLLMGWASRGVPALHSLTAFSLTPEVVLFVFLPVLLFEAAFNLDARRLLKNVLPISTLAVPGLLISIATVGFGLHYILGLPLGLALLFGSLISATDPVAVVALFKEMGAPKRLGLLVEGESLFNDGTALVVFNIILGVVVSGLFTSHTVTKGVLNFAVVVTGGIGVGIALGVVFSRIIEIVENDRLVEITLTTILAHSTFLTAEHVLHVSGVIATVAAGLTMGSYGRNKISPPVQEHMEAFWEYFAFVCNSFIFLLVGMSIDMGLFVENFGAILLAALVVLAARALAVYGLFPVVEGLKLAEKVDAKFQTVIFWGGLRGALAIVMALSIPHDLPQRDFLLVLTLGVVLFSLLVNGLTIKKLMSLLGLDRYSLKERFERVQAILEAKEEASKSIPAFSEERAINKSVLEKWQRRQARAMRTLTGELDELKGELKDEDESEVVLRHLLFMERGRYMEMFEEGLLREDNLKEMRLSIDRQIDRLKEGREVYRPMELSLAGRIAGFLSAYTVFRPLTRSYKTARIAANYELQHARRAASAAVLKEIDHLSHHENVSGRTIGQARELYEMLHEKAVSRMQAIRSEYPEYVEKVEAGVLRRLALCVERNIYKELYSRGAITAKVLSEMHEGIDTSLRRMKLRPVRELKFSPSKLVSMVPYFSELDEDELRRLTSKLHARSFLMGETIVRQGEEGDSLFIIGRGQVEVIGKDDFRLARLRAGDFFGETALLHPQPRTATVTAATPCTLLELDRDRFLPFLDHAPHLKDTLEAAYRSRVLNTLISGIPLFARLDSKERDDVAALMRYVSFGENTLVVEEGSPGGVLYIIREGEGELSRGGIMIGRLKAGQFFGDKTLVDKKPYGATLRTVGKAEMYMLDSESLLKVPALG